MKFWWILAVLAGGCGPQAADRDGAADANQIARLAAPPAPRDEADRALVVPITAAALAREGLSGTGCRFARGGATLLVTAGSDSLVMTPNGPRHLVHSAPVGPTGGFFEDRQLSVSVGRSDDADGEPARMTVTNRRSRVEQRADGRWTCGV